MTNPLHSWLADWLPPELHSAALADLQQRLAPPASVSIATSSEGAALNAVRLEAGRRGWRLFRNNLGAMQDPRTGRVVRYGLANESKQMNEAVKSGDLIGPVPMIVEQHHVGRQIALFGSVECKAKGARTDPERIAAQERWRDLVLSMGGYAVITDGSLP